MYFFLQCNTYLSACIFPSDKRFRRDYEVFTLFKLCDTGKKFPKDENYVDVRKIFSVAYL